MSQGLLQGNVLRTFVKPVSLEEKKEKKKHNVRQKTQEGLTVSGCFACSHPLSSKWARFNLWSLPHTSAEYLSFPSLLHPTEES